MCEGFHTEFRCLTLNFLFRTEFAPLTLFHTEFFGRVMLSDTVTFVKRWAGLVSLLHDKLNVSRICG